MTFETKYTDDSVLSAMSTTPELPSVIAKRLGCSTRTIQRVLKRLETDGKVVKTHVGGTINAYSVVAQ